MSCPMHPAPTPISLPTLHTYPVTLSVSVSVSDHWVSFVWDYFHIWSLSWGVVDLPGVTPWMRNTLPSPSNYQIPVTSIKGRALFLPLFSMLRSCLAWVCPGFMHANMISMTSPAHLPCFCWETLYEVSYLLCLLEPFHHPLLHRTLSLRGRGPMHTSHLGLSTSAS